MINSNIPDFGNRDEEVKSFHTKLKDTELRKVPSDNQLYQIIDELEYWHQTRKCKGDRMKMKLLDILKNAEPFGLIPYQIVIGKNELVTAIAELEELIKTMNDIKVRDECLLVLCNDALGTGCKGHSVALMMVIKALTIKDEK